MELVIFEQNKPLVLQALGRGEFEYIEAASESFETEFFRFIEAQGLLRKLAATYPTPREKEEVPIWFYLASNLSLRLHGVNAFHSFPLVVRTGGMINAFAGKPGQKTTHPDTGEVTLECRGFNRKSHYGRQTPCDQDFLRKLARDTEATALLRWFNRDVPKAFRGRKVFDPEGLFLGDASYLFVPDNPNYEGSVRLRFDAHNHPVSREEYEKKEPSERALCRWRRCYKIVTLLHTNRRGDLFVFTGLRVVSGKDHECPILYDMVEEFIQSVGPGVIKRLIVDRGFLDGAAISRCKQTHGIDVLIPVRRNMDIYEDALALFALPEVKWHLVQTKEEEPVPRPRPRPEAVARREAKRQETLRQRQTEEPPPPPERTLFRREVATVDGFTSWSSCTVPLTVVATREHYADGHQETWFLLDTCPGRDPVQVREEYHLRTGIEERYRQIKCFSDLTRFTSRSFSLIVNQVVFLLLAHGLLQIYLYRRQQENLNHLTLPHLGRRLLPGNNYFLVCWKNYYARFDPYEYTDLIASLGAAARKKIASKSRRMSQLFLDGIANPRSP